jgi:hypothetical protein
MADNHPKQKQRDQQDEEQSRPNAGNKDSTNPGQTGTPGGKGKQDAPQNQKR